MFSKVGLGFIILTSIARVAGIDRPIALVRLSDLNCGGYVYPRQIVWLSGGRAEETALRQRFSCRPGELPTGVRKSIGTK